GHVIVNPDGLRCQCGARGCLEMYASARGFERVANEMADKRPNGRLARLRKKRGQLSGPELAEAIRAGDATAKAVLDQCCRWLAAGIETWCVIFMPERVLLGGGVAAIGRPLLQSVRESFADIAQPYVIERTKIDLAALGNDAGMIGAASLWFH
ncbi:MAG TPA: ROK family protein, partial [Phycisphaerae bacterium]|nr:ROK family protein [Phycisphaerae bacterium]